MTTTNILGRREFLKTATQAATTVAVCQGLTTTTAGTETPGRSSGTIPTRTLGRTGLKLPILGYGGAALPKRWANPLSHEDRVALVRYAYDQGLRYFDTSPVYMESEAILGEALEDRRRQVCLVTKVESTRPEQVRKSVEQSLKTLRTDYLDVVLIHGTPGLEQMSVAQAMKVHAELVKLRNEKVTRFVGLSAHGYFDTALALIASGGFDVCTLSYGYIPRGDSRIWTAHLTTLRDACLAKAWADKTRRSPELRVHPGFVPWTERLRTERRGNSWAPKERFSVINFFVRLPLQGVSL